MDCGGQEGHAFQSFHVDCGGYNMNAMAVSNTGEVSVILLSFVYSPRSHTQAALEYPITTLMVITDQSPLSMHT